MIAGALAALISAVGLAGCAPESECAAGAGCVAAIDTATSPRAIGPDAGLQTGSPVGTLAAERHGRLVCFSLLQHDGRRSALAFPPGTHATPAGSRGGYTVLGEGVGGLSSGDRVVVTPHSTATRAAVAGCPSGTVFFTSQMTRIAPAPAASSGTPQCDEVRTAPFDCHRYRSTSGTDPELGHLAWLHTDPIEMWVEPLDGRMTLVIKGPVGTLTAPISVNGYSGTSRPSGRPGTGAGCSGGSGCTHAAWLASCFSHVAHASAQTPAQVTISNTRKQFISFTVTTELPPA